MSRSKKYFYFFWFISLLIGFIINGCASTQVTNNSGSLLNKVKVGTTEFSENLDYCADGCSTGFKWVVIGDKIISLRVTDASSWITIGNLGPFGIYKHYAVNIRADNGNFCAELWKRNQTDSTFNDDTTRELIQSLCPE